jgi:S1-C subfamily serine protease
VKLPRPPDWLVYGIAACAILFVARGRQERADAPQAPPPLPGDADLPLAASSPFAPAQVVPVGRAVETVSGTAFSVGDGGVWLTARHVIDGCRRSAIVVAAGRGVAARLRAVEGDLAILTTEGGAPALPIAPAGGLQPGQPGFHPGFPQGQAGEAASRLLGPQIVRDRARAAQAPTLLAWSEIGRTEGVSGALAGLSGAPVLDGAGDVVGVTLAQAPRRGRIYTTTTEALRRALADAHVAVAPAGGDQPIAVDNYGRAADTLRRDLRVTQVVCLAG